MIDTYGLGQGSVETGARERRAAILRELPASLDIEKCGEAPGVSIASVRG